MAADLVRAFAMVDTVLPRNGATEHRLRP
eukprot:COSAG05_NODE_17749_length_320_cov_0.434389_1_plen_28_part_10